MKKTFKTLALIFLCLIGFQWLITCLIQRHQVDYNIKDKKVTYQIKENFEVVSKQPVYTIQIRAKDKKFHFQYIYNYHKQKQIVTKIIAETEGQTTCLYPILLDKKQSYLHCYDGKEEFSYDILVERNHNLAQKIEKRLQKENITLSNTNLSVKYKAINYYPKTLENKHLIVWAYQGLYYLKDDSAKMIKLLHKDQYENQYGILVGNIYMLANSDEEYDYTKFYLINIKTGRSKEWKLQEAISKDSYFLGVVDKSAYLFDRDNLKEYRLTPSKQKIELIGDKTNNGLYYQGNWHKKNIYNFKTEKLTFPSTVKVEKIEKNYPKAQIYQDLNCYYFIDKNQLYVSYKGYQNQPILLISGKAFKEVKVVNRIVYYIEKDTIYQYSQVKNLQKVFTSRELQFNYHNIYDVYLAK